MELVSEAGPTEGLLEITVYGHTKAEMQGGPVTYTNE